MRNQFMDLRIWKWNDDGTENIDNFICILQKCFIKWHFSPYLVRVEANFQNQQIAKCYKVCEKLLHDDLNRMGKRIKK